MTQHGAPPDDPAEPIVGDEGWQDASDQEPQHHHDASEPTQPLRQPDRSHEIPSSRYIVRSIDGLRMALAGFPAHQRVVVGEGCEIEARTIAELRMLESVSYRLEVLIPYRLLPESVVGVNLLSAEWQDTER